MRRREMITLLGSAAIAWPHDARGQAPANRPVIAWLGGGKTGSGEAVVNAFRTGLKELGYEEGRNIELVIRSAEGREDRLPALAEEIVRSKPAVILAAAVNVAAAVRKHTNSIPIVTAALADAVRLGLVASYRRPGGNVTGIAPYIDGLPGKQLQFALELVPGARKIGLLGNMNDPKGPAQRNELIEGARNLGLMVVMPEVSQPEDIGPAMQTLASDGVEVVVVLQTSMLLSEREPIAAAAATHRLPAVYGYRPHVQAGGLFSYGVDLLWCFHRAAAYVDKILKGEPPAELPVEFPARVQMVVNVKTANALGLTIPDSILIRADEIIE